MQRLGNQVHHDDVTGSDMAGAVCSNSLVVQRLKQFVSPADDHGRAHHLRALYTLQVDLATHPVCPFPPPRNCSMLMSYAVSLWMGSVGFGVVGG